MTSGRRSRSSPPRSPDRRAPTWGSGPMPRAEQSRRAHDPFKAVFVISVAAELAGVHPDLPPRSPDRRAPTWGSGPMPRAEQSRRAHDPFKAVFVISVAAELAGVH